MMTVSGLLAVTHTPVAQFWMRPNFMRVLSAFIFIATLQGMPSASVMSGTYASVCGAGGGGSRGERLGTQASQLPSQPAATPSPHNRKIRKK